MNIKLRQEVAAFVRHSRIHGFKPLTRKRVPHIGIWTKDGRDFPALAIYEGLSGSWHMMSEIGAILHFSKEDVL
jgi:hypothetical protein